MYEVARDEAWELFGTHLDGAQTGLVCVVSSHPLDERSRVALESSAEALGYGRAACTYVTLEGGLDAQALFLLLEGLDPLCLVATDEAAARTLGETYRCRVELMKPSRAFGRTVVAFRSFSTMLDDGQDKQVAWALLKKLPRFGE